MTGVLDLRSKFAPWPLGRYASAAPLNYQPLYRADCSATAGTFGALQTAGGHTGGTSDAPQSATMFHYETHKKSPDSQR
jgi:hypothetical protein